MELADALSFAFQRADATQTFWNIFAVVSTALLGYVTSAKAEWLNRLTCTALTFSFVLFAMANFGALNQLRQQRAALFNLLAGFTVSNPELSHVVASMRPPELNSLLGLHLALDTTVVTLIWLVPLLRHRRPDTQGSTFYRIYGS